MDYQTILLLLALWVQPFASSFPDLTKPLNVQSFLAYNSKNPHKALTKLLRIYGPLMTLKSGSISTIVISSPQVAKRVLHENILPTNGGTLEEFVPQKYSPHKCSTPLKSFANKSFGIYWILWKKVARKVRLWTLVRLSLQQYLIPFQPLRKASRVQEHYSGYDGRSWKA